MESDTSSSNDKTNLNILFNRNIIFIILTVLVLLIGILTYTRNKVSSTKPSGSSVHNSSVSTTSHSYSKWQNYTDAQSQVSIDYPSDWGKVVQPSTASPFPVFVSFASPTQLNTGGVDYFVTNYTNLSSFLDYMKKDSSYESDSIVHINGFSYDNITLKPTSPIVYDHQFTFLTKIGKIAFIHVYGYSSDLNKDGIPAFQDPIMNRVKY